jgi:hypothetical protein
MDFFINSQKLQSYSCGEIVRMQARVCKKRAGILPYFFPQAEAGWDEDNPYWAPNKIEAWMKDQVIFLTPELRCPPFAWPQYGKRKPSSDQIVTYPADETTDLITPVARTKPKYVRKRKHEGKQDCTMKKEKHEMMLLTVRLSFKRRRKTSVIQQNFRWRKRTKMNRQLCKNQL